VGQWPTVAAATAYQPALEAALRGNAAAAPAPIADIAAALLGACSAASC
jgi:hypothetical protein